MGHLAMESSITISMADLINRHRGTTKIILQLKWHRVSLKSCETVESN